jgi:hypothetical protein
MNIRQIVKEAAIYVRGYQDALTERYYEAMEKRADNRQSNLSEGAQTANSAATLGVSGAAGAGGFATGKNLPALNDTRKQYLQKVKQYLQDIKLQLKTPKGKNSLLTAGTTAGATALGFGASRSLQYQPQPKPVPQLTVQQIQQLLAQMNVDHKEGTDVVNIKK